MRTLLFTSALSVLLAASACSKKDAQPAPVTPEPEPAESTEGPSAPEPTETEPTASTPTGNAQYPGLQVLPASWGEAELSAFMKEVSAGLGVQCDHCHDIESWADETPMKGKAREMMRMTMSLDSEFLGGAQKLTCATCHKGKTSPAE